MLSDTSETDNSYQLKATFEVLVTAEKGDRLTRQENFYFRQGKAEGVVIEVYPDLTKQTLHGIGTSFTEASAFVLAHLTQAQRAEVMLNLFGEQGANFTMARTPIGSCDFCVSGQYCYAAQAGDLALESFSIDVDQDGFSRDQYTGIKDSSFDLLPMIKQALDIKHSQSDSTLKIVASAWTAPPWMKDNQDWYTPGNVDNQFNGTGGVLKPEYQSSYAQYLNKYLEAYREQGVDIWALTPVNEPLGNNGQWESMHFTPESQNEFIKHHLGPALKSGANSDVELFIYDHSRDQLEQWADVIYSDPESAQYVCGAAVHWYESTFRVFDDVFERVHEKYPGYSIIHSEGCIDDLGKDAPEGVLDPERYKESGWFNNDDFWWNDNATDYAYSVTWAGVNAEDHPIYTPVHRYARNIIVSLNHWVSGWIDWNMVLDEKGGPNHVGNYCGAPIMIDVESGYVYYTPIFYVLSQLSRTIRPGDKAIKVTQSSGEHNTDDLHAFASINEDQQVSVQVLNTTKNSIEFNLQIADQFAPITIPANALQTVRFQL